MNMESEKINNPAEILRDKILKSSGLKTLQSLIASQNNAAEKAVELQSKVRSHEEDVRRFSIQLDKMQDSNPEDTVKINSLKAQIDEANGSKSLAEEALGKNNMEQWKVNDEISYVARLALEKHRAKFVGDLLDKQIGITIVPQIWTDAVTLLGEKIPGLAGLPSELRTMSYIGTKPIDCKIN
jgi:DNA repair exonuclease SbcCD ATPase subunit